MGARTGLRALAGVLLLGVLYVVLALPLLVVAFATGAIVDHGRFFTSGAAVLWGLGVVAVVALLLELAGPRRLPVGLAVDAVAQPVLWELVEDVAVDLRVPVPDGIVLTGGAGCELRVVRRPGTLLHRHLVLGGTLPYVMTGRRLRVVIAHALGHSRRRRPPLVDRIACHGVDAVVGLADAFVGRGASARIAAGYAALYRRVCAPVVGFEERAADRAAARAYGTEAVVDALTELALARADWRRFRDELLVPGMVAGCVPRDPIAGFRAFRAERDEAGSEPEPALVTRIERLRARPTDGRGTPGGTDLVGGASAEPRLLAHVHPYLLATDDDGHLGRRGFAPLDGLVKLSDEAFLGHLLGFGRARRAAALGMSARRAGVEYPVTLGGVLGLLVEGRGDELVARHGEDTAEALAALLECAWVESGRGRIRPCWAGTGTVTDHDGVELDLAAAAEAALAGAAGARALRDRLRAAGVSTYFEPKPPLSIADGERETVVGHR
ncbi:hypothetical protein ACFRCG_14930 [Embleya sp. NPDC056575]|uniref:hypothetical protein n=1 Tax=unclassified Embleya TaxID=2699296 RepID=UPI00369C7626